jgi:hypothetical protein
VTIHFPDGVAALGNTSVIIASTILDPEAPTLAELTPGVGVANASCFVYAIPRATTTAARVARPKRSCERKARERFGQETTELVSLNYAHAPQENAAHADNKVKTLATPYTQVWVVLRDGLPAETEAIATGDIVDLHLVELGPQNKGVTGDGDGDEFNIMQDVTVRESHTDVVVVAA